MERRNFITASGATLVTAITGCLSSDNSDTDPEETPNDTNSSDDTPNGDTSDESSDPTPIGDINNYDPESTAQQYYEALNDGNETLANELSHPDGVTINTNETMADTFGNEYSINVKRTEITQTNHPYFEYANAIVDVGMDRTRNGNTFATGYQVVLVVHDDELLVWDTNDQDNEIEDRTPTDTCDISDEDDLFEIIPYTSARFYQAQRGDGIDSVDALYRGPNGNRFDIEIELHDSEEEAQEADLRLGASKQNALGEWTTEAALLARKDTITYLLHTDTEDATEELEELYEATGCFTDEHIIEQS